MMKNKITYTIKNNEDWNNLNEGELLVDISNDSYFGFRAMEKNANSIAYDPVNVNTLVRVGKESKKFPNTIHTLILDVDSLGFEASNSEENFLKLSTRVIEELLELNNDIRLDFIIKSEDLDNEFIYKTLSKLYLKNV